MDNTKNDYEWNLSDELSSALYAQISSQDKVILNPSSKVRLKARATLDQHNPFDKEIGWAKKAFQDEEFVVFLELIEHDEVLNQSRSKPVDPATCSAELKMGVRLRVLDLRGATPRVVLQEIVRSAHALHPQFTRVNFYQVSWKDQSFHDSPLGIAHAKLIRELAERIEDYILIAVNG
jgi:hypothetical protein